MAMAFCARGLRARGGVVHRRRRIVARRVARGDQPVRGAPAAGDLLPRRTTRRRSRRRCATTRPSACSPTRRPATAFPASPIDGTDPDAIAAAFTWAAERARAGRGPDADRARRDAHVRPRASRRHALSRQGSAAVVGLPAAARGGYANRELYDVLGASAIRLPRYAATPRGRGPHRRRRSRSHQA